MQIYYINLARRPDRRAFMEAQFEKLGLKATRIEAVTPDEVPTPMRDEFCNPDCDEFLSVTDLCCSLSHVRAYEALLAGTEHYALIFEDDAVLSSHLPEFLQAFEAMAPQGDLVRIETSNRGIRSKGVQCTLAGIDIVRPYSWEAGAAGYIINRKAAAILARSRVMRRETTDEVILHPFGRHRATYRILQTVPGLCVQSHLLRGGDVPNLGSDLNSVARPSHSDQSRAARTRRFAKLLFRREIVMGGQQFVHQLLGARKRVIPFLP